MAMKQYWPYEGLDLLKLAELQLKKNQSRPKAVDTDDV